MEYGYMVSGQLIRVKTQTSESKPLAYTDEPTVDEYHATAYNWVDKGTTIEQVWETIEIDPVEQPEELNDSEVLNIILGGESL